MNAIKKQDSHQHGGKSSEALVDKKLILEHLPLTTGQVVLDVGCGNGYMAKAFSKYVGRSGTVFAIDPHEPSIERLRRETAEQNIAAFVGDITQPTTIPGAFIDLLYLSTVFHGFSESQIAGFIAEARRLLHPAGTLAVVEIVKEDTPFGPPLELRFSPEELRQVIGLEPAGCFEVGEYLYLQLFKNREM